jgi:hypothetical protein
VRGLLVLFALVAALVSGWLVYGVLALPAPEVMRVVIAAFFVFVAAAATILTGNQIGMAFAPAPR